MQAQAAQTGLVLVMAREVDQAWGLLNPADMKSTLPRFKLAVAALMRKYGLASGALSAQFYRRMRTDAGVVGRITINPASPAPLGQVDTVIGWATRGLWEPQPDVTAARTLVEGATEKMVLDVGRDTIIDTVRHDRAAKAWARVTEPAPCFFCALLASRGAVYKHETVGFEPHDHCRCHAEPVFNAYEPTAQVREWQALYERVTGPFGGKAKLVAFRQAYEGRPITGGKAGKAAVARAAEPKIGGRTRSEIRAELSALERNLPRLTAPDPIAYHEKRIAALRALLG